MSRFGALTVDDRGGWARFPALALARGDIERMVDALQGAVPIPQHEVRMRCALRRQVLRQRLPLATRREHIEDCVENLANIHLAPTAATLGWRDHRLDQRPFGIRQIARISQTAPLCGAPMFRFPHLGTPSDDSGAAQGITNDSSDSTTFWIGSKIKNRSVWPRPEARSRPPCDSTIEHQIESPIASILFHSLVLMPLCLLQLGDPHPSHITVFLRSDVSRRSPYDRFEH